MRTLASLLLLTCIQADAAARGVSIPFPDGTSVEVQARPNPRWRALNSDAAPLAEIYPSLRQEAEGGDASAAWLLYFRLNSCSSFAYADEASLEAAIEHMYRTGEIVAPGGAPSPLPPGANRAQVEEDLFRRPYRHCLGITPQQRAETDTWLKRAAGMGYPPAATQYAHRLGRSREALRMYEFAWNDGDYAAAGFIGRLYDRRKTGEVPPDPVKALAYAYVYHRMTLERFAGATTPVRSRFADDASQDLERRMSEATPKVREAAMKLAKRLLKENRNCCYGF